MEREGDLYYEGIWESVQYLNPIRGTLQIVYAHPEPDAGNANLINRMESINSVGVHVRRGDYQYSEAFRGICDLDYYARAIKEILSDGESHEFFIFSNDMAWCEENLRPLVGNNPLTMVTHNKGEHSCWDMFLMTHCKDLIIANSSFSWWSAFLNKRYGRVVTPDKWVNREAEFDIWLPEWIRV